MALSVRVRFEPLRSLAYTSISSVYAMIGSSVDHPIRIMKLDNLTNATLFFSEDGINDQLVLPANGFVLFDFTSNKASEQGFSLSEGDSLYVRAPGDLPTLGAVYFSVVYGSFS